jgi:hypothetical protein
LSWGIDEPEKIVLLSQSSATDAASKLSPGESNVYQSMPSTCCVCKEKPSRVILKVSVCWNYEI